MEIKRKLRAIFQLVTKSAFWNLLTDFNMHWFHSELQTIIYTDLSLSALINLLTCLSLSLRALRSSSSFSLASSCSLSSCFHSKLLKIQVTLLNNLSRNHLADHIKLNILGYGITYLACNSTSLCLLPCLLFSCQSAFLSLKCQEIASVKHSFIAQVYCENELIFLLNLNMKYIHSLRSSAPLTEKVTKFNMNINLIEQG